MLMGRRGGKILKLIRQGKESHSNQWDYRREFLGTLFWGIIQGNDSHSTSVTPRLSRNSPLGNKPNHPPQPTFKFPKSLGFDQIFEGFNQL